MAGPFHVVRRTWMHGGSKRTQLVVSEMTKPLLRGEVIAHHGPLTEAQAVAELPALKFTNTGRPLARSVVSPRTPHTR
jgi:hypothetical protein